MSETQPNSPLNAYRTLAARLRCSVCGGQRTTVAEQPYRLVADDGEVLRVAVLVCQDCRQIRLFEVDSQDTP